VLTWNEFRAARPELAEAGRALLYQFGVGLAFLGTVRRDGGPRLHPMCPVVVDEGLFGLLIPSPKLADLRRDPRCALHSFPSAENEDAFYVTGRAEVRNGGAVRRAVDRAFLAERHLDAAPPGFDEQTLVEFLVETCLLTRTTGHGDWAPRHEVWPA
jgi:Pyridoxamine 5'-phosphate oxidase